jgi:cytochrome c peroxidase
LLWAEDSTTIRCFPGTHDLACILPSSAIGLTDIHPASIGVGGKKRTRHSPAVINSAYSSLQFWDGRAPSLEEQAKRPIENPVEMATTHAVVVKRLARFKQAWGTEDITIEIVVNSIPSFERTVLSGNSRFGRFYYGHDKKGAVRLGARLAPAVRRPQERELRRLSHHRKKTMRS